MFTVIYYYVPGVSKFFRCQQVHEISTVIISILQMGNRGIERLSELPKVTQLVSGQIQTQAVRTQGL